MSAPDLLLISIEKLMLDVTEGLDPLVSLQLTSLTRQITDVAYMMGHQDGQRDTVCTSASLNSVQHLQIHWR